MRYEFKQGQRYRATLAIGGMKGRLATIRAVEQQLAKHGLRASAFKLGSGRFQVFATWDHATKAIDLPAEVEEICPV